MCRCKVRFVLKKCLNCAAIFRGEGMVNKYIREGAREEVLRREKEVKTKRGMGVGKSNKVFVFDEPLFHNLTPQNYSLLPSSNV